MFKKNQFLLTVFLMSQTLFEVSTCIELQLYRIMKGTRVADVYNSDLSVGDPFSVKNPLLCLAGCNSHPNCSVVTLINETICTFYSNETTLFELEKFFGSRLFSTFKLPPCPWRTTFYNESLNECQPLKLYNETCGQVSCMHNKNLVCIHQNCKCTNEIEQ